MNTDDKVGPDRIDVIETKLIQHEGRHGMDRETEGIVKLTDCRLFSAFLNEASH